MRQGDLLFSAVHLFVVTLLLALGVVCVIAAASSAVRFNLSEVLFCSPDILWKIGLIVIGVSILLFVALFALNRKRYLELDVKGNPVSLSRSLVEEVVSAFLTLQVPGVKIAAEVEVTKKGMEIVVPIANISEEMLGSIEENLPNYLLTQLGKNHSCVLKLV